MRLVNLATADTALAGRNGLPAPAEAGFHGIAIHWIGASLPRGGKLRKLAPTIPIPTWMIQRVRFGAVNVNRSEDPPRDAVATNRAVRLAFALVATHHPIPSDATVYFEIRP